MAVNEIKINSKDVIVESDPDICLVNNGDGIANVELVSTGALETIAREIDKEECKYHNFCVDFALGKSGEIEISKTLQIISNVSAETSYEMSNNEAAQVFEATTEQLPSVYPEGKTGSELIASECYQKFKTRRERPHPFMGCGFAAKQL